MLSPFPFLILPIYLLLSHLLFSPPISSHPIPCHAIPSHPSHLILSPAYLISRCVSHYISHAGPSCSKAGKSLLFVLVLAPRVFLQVLRFFSLHKNELDVKSLQFELDVKSLHMSPSLGRLGDYSLRYDVKFDLPFLTFFIHCKNHYPAPLDSGLSSGSSYPTFEQLVPDYLLTLAAVVSLPELVSNKMLFSRYVY